MLNNISNMLRYFGAHSTDIIVNVVIMASAVIVAIGLLKPIFFNKIQNKYIRKAALSFSNIIGCFVCALVYFLIEGWGFKYYFIAAFALSIWCIITYWLYENTCLRNLINVVGGLALRKVFTVIKVAITEDDANAVKTEIQNATTQLKPAVKQELKKAASTIKVDKDLINL